MPRRTLEMQRVCTGSRFVRHAARCLHARLCPSLSRLPPVEYGFLSTNGLFAMMSRAARTFDAAALDVDDCAGACSGPRSRAGSAVDRRARAHRLRAHARPSAHKQAGVENRLDFGGALSRAAARACPCPCPASRAVAGPPDRARISPDSGAMKREGTTRPGFRDGSARQCKRCCALSGPSWRPSRTRRRDSQIDTDQAARALGRFRPICQPHLGM